MTVTDKVAHPQNRIETTRQPVRARKSMNLFHHTWRVKRKNGSSSSVISRCNTPSLWPPPPPLPTGLANLVPCKTRTVSCTVLSWSGNFTWTNTASLNNGLSRSSSSDISLELHEAKYSEKQRLSCWWITLRTGMQNTSVLPFLSGKSANTGKSRETHWFLKNRKASLFELLHSCIVRYSCSPIPLDENIWTWYISVGSIVIMIIEFWPGFNRSRHQIRFETRFLKGL